MPRSKPAINQEIVFVDSTGIERTAYVAAVNEGTTPPTIDVSHTPIGGPPPHPDNLPHVKETYRVVHEDDMIEGRSWWREVDEDRPIVNPAPNLRPPTDPGPAGTVKTISLEEAENVLELATEEYEALEDSGADVDALKASKERMEHAQGQVDAAKAAEKQKEDVDKARATAEKANREGRGSTTTPGARPVGHTPKAGAKHGKK